MPLGIEDDDSIGCALEKVGVALQRAEASLCFETRNGDLLGLIAQRLHDSGVSQRNRHGVRNGLAEIELAIAEGERLFGAEKEDANGARLVENR